jgi:hypothetical protein
LVVYLNDAVQETHDDQEAAYVAGVRRFGVRGGFVIGYVPS